MKIYKLVDNSWEYIECNEEDIDSIKISLEKEWEIVQIEQETEGGCSIVYNTLS